jgi:hypothetical protein
MRRALLILAMGLAASAIATGAASAGIYQVTACADAPSLVNNSWQPFNNDPTYLETPANCGNNEITGFSPETSGLAAADVLGLSTNTPEGAVAGWTFAAPQDDMITAISMDRDLFNDGPGWLPQVIDDTGAPLPGEVCPYSNHNGGCETSGAVSHTGLDTTSLTIEVLCSPASEGLTECGGGTFLHSARAELDGAIVTITDEQPPRITSTSGQLFTGSLVRGTIIGTIDGSDNSGVQYARLYVDGAQVAQQASSCDFTQTAPCPTSSSNQFSLDTTTLSNGPHEIQAAVVDAAGNQTLGSPVQITVENTAPIVPTTPTTPVTPPTTPLPPVPIIPGKPGKASPRLQILDVTRTKQALHVRGVAAKTLVGRVTIVVHYTLGGRSHSVQKTVRVAHGKWAAVIGLPGGAWTNRASVLYRGTALWLGQTVTRYVHHRAASMAKESAGGPKRGFARLEAIKGRS